MATMTWLIGFSGLLLFGSVGFQTTFEENETPAESPIIDVLQWRDFRHQFPPFTNYGDVEKFLESARVVSMRHIGEGVNNPQKVLLELDGIRLNAVFRDVRFQPSDARTPTGKVVPFFRDDAIFEVAAYRLAKLLGLENIPPTVVRKVGLRTGSLQAWVEDSRSIKGLARDNLHPPAGGLERWRWNMEQQVIFIFDNLVYNEDRNLGNTLIGKEGRVWMIDHTRAFQRWKKLPFPENIQYCERQLWERLKALDPVLVRDQLRGLVTLVEVNGLLDRAQRLVRHIQGLIDQRGEKRVLFEWR